MRLALLRWIFALTLAVLFVTLPYGYYRWRYDHDKRLRVVTPGKLYRSGQMTAQGLEEAVGRFHIRTVLNLQDAEPDPEIEAGLPESQFLRQRGVEYRFILVDLLKKWDMPDRRPLAIEQFLAIMDDPGNYPMLIHCHAGLHRTGVLVAFYRMEYEGWTRDEAIRELKLNGFGQSACTSRNDYIQQYLLADKPDARRTNQRARASKGVSETTP